MINIDIIKPYIIKLNDFDKTFIKHELDKLTLEEMFDKCLHYLDATRITSDNKFHIIQTIDYTYKCEMSRTIYFISNYLNNDDVYYQKLIERHLSNIEFEKVNPPIVYSRKNKKKPARKVKEPTLAGSKRVSKKDVKLMEKVNKFKTLSFNFKQVK